MITRRAGIRFNFGAMKKIEEIEVDDTVLSSYYREENMGLVFGMFKLEGYGNIQLNLSFDEAFKFANYIQRSLRKYLEMYRGSVEDKEHVSEWFEVSEELPPENSAVLFVTASDETSLCSFYSGYMDENEWWISDDGSMLETYGTPGSPIGVLYWRYLKTN